MSDGIMCCSGISLWYVRQGGVLSPVLFAVYVDDIIERLNDSKLDCLIGNLYSGCIMHADDLILISALVFSVHFAEDDFYLCK